jgi:FkbM family methyltransferase
MYPDSEIVVIEPEISNQKILARNVGDLHGVTIINGRVNYDTQDAVLEVNPVNSGCHRIMPRELAQPGQSVIPVPEPVTIEQIMEQQGWATLDLLKLDCEGAEVDILFNCSEETLKVCRRIVGEFHAGPDAFLNGIGSRLQSLGFTVSAELNPAAHATFLAVNQNWQEEVFTSTTFVEDMPVDYGIPELPAKKPAVKRGRKAKK